MSNNGKPKYDGERVRLGDQEFVLPSLSTRQARMLWPKILELDRDGVTKDTLSVKMGIGVELIHAALSRNYPNITIDEVEDLVDMGNFKRLSLIITGQSGLLSPGAKPAAEAGDQVSP